MNDRNRPRRGRPERLGDVLATMFRRAGMNEIARLQRVASAWKECLPAHARSGSRVTKLVDGVIYAAVDSAPLNFELSGFLKPELLRRIRQKDVGYVRDIRFKVVSPSTSSSTGADVSPRATPKRDPNYNPAH